MAHASPLERELGSILLLSGDAKNIPKKAKRIIEGINKLNITKQQAQRVMQNKQLRRVAKFLGEKFASDQDLGKTLLLAVKKIKSAASGTPQQSPSSASGSPPYRGASPSRPTINLVAANKTGAAHIRTDRGMLPRRSPRVSVQIATNISQSEAKMAAPPARKQLSQLNSMKKKAPVSSEDRDAKLRAATAKIRQNYQKEKNKKRNRTVAQIDMSEAPTQRKRAGKVRVGGGGGGGGSSRIGRKTQPEKVNYVQQEQVQVDFF